MARDEQARQRLVEIALQAARTPMRHTGLCRGECVIEPVCVAYAARALAGLQDPKKGPWCAAGLTAAMAQAGLRVPAPGTPARRGAIALLDFVADASGQHVHKVLEWAQPGDIIAWLQYPPPDPAGWRRGHVAVIVAMDDESITTVGWNEGPAPGRVMMRRLWRDREHEIPVSCAHPSCSGCVRLPRVSETVFYRRPGGLYGVARPVAR